MFLCLLSSGDRSGMRYITLNIIWTYVKRTVTQTISICLLVSKYWRHPLVHLFMSTGTTNFIQQWRVSDQIRKREGSLQTWILHEYWCYYKYFYIINRYMIIDRLVDAWYDLKTSLIIRLEQNMTNIWLYQTIT